MLVKEIPAGYKEWLPKYGPYSPSRLIAGRCPQRFYGQYVRGDRSVGASLAASRGNAIHEVCAKIDGARVHGQTLTTRMVDEWVAAAVGRYPAAYEQVDLVKGAASAYAGNPCPYVNETTKCEVGLGIRYFEEILKDESVAPNVLFLSAPYELESRLNKAVFFGGRLDQVSLDRVTETITIVDHKSSPSANVNEDHNFQLGCYAWLVSLFYPQMRIRTVLHFAHPGLNFYRPPQFWSPEELQNIGAYMLNRVRALESFVEFPAIPGSHCDYCHMVQECPENLALEEQRARGLIDLNVRTTEDLKKLTERLHVTGKLYDDLQKSVKQGLSKFGLQSTGVAIEGSWYGFKTSEEAVDWAATDEAIKEKAMHARAALEQGNLQGEERAKAELMSKLENLGDVLHHYGVNPEHFKEWKGARLKELWKLDNPPLIDLIRGYIVKDRNTKFSKHKF